MNSKIRDVYFYATGSHVETRLDTNMHPVVTGALPTEYSPNRNNERNDLLEREQLVANSYTVSASPFSTLNTVRADN